METDGLLTTPEVAQRLGITIPRVHQLVKDGRLPSKQFGRTHLIREADLALVAERKPGRPKKTAEAEAIAATRASAPVSAQAKKSTNGAAAKPAKKRAAKQAGK